MTITLIRGGERVDLTADDELLLSSLVYGGVFERQVKLVVERFYPALDHSVEEHAG